MKNRLLLSVFLCLATGFSVAQVLPAPRGNAPWQISLWTPSDSPMPPLRAAVNPLRTTADSVNYLLDEARKHLGKPYHYGGRGPKAFDCAGFVRFVYLNLGFNLPGGAGSQYHHGRRIKDRKQLHVGDLVFFQGREANGRVGHVGIVTEVDSATGVFRFIHAATSTGVIYSLSTEPYYARRYVGATRLLPAHDND